MTAAPATGGRGHRATGAAGAAARVLVVAVLVGSPLWLVLVNSVKPLAAARNLSLDVSGGWAAGGNYSTALHDGNVLRGLLNSVIVVVPSLLVALLLGALAAWVFARTTSRLVRFVYYVMLLGLLLPPAVVATVQWLQRLHIFGGYLGVIAFYIGAYLPLAVFLLTGFVRTIPVELEEAARMDGNSELRIFLGIVLPLLRPALVSLFLMILVFAWNDFYYPFFLLSDSDKLTLPLGLFRFVGGHVFQTQWNVIMADVVLTSIPLVVVFLVAQRRMITGVTAGGVNR